MTLLSQWLKEIIFIILFAVFIELLLPNRSMERYVKFVISLLILLTLLSPIMKLFTDQTEKKIEVALTGGFDVEDGNVQAETKKILAEGNELQKKREQEVMAWTGEEIARQMKEQLKNVTGQPINRVAVGLTNLGNKKETTITSIEVVMGASLQAQSEPTAQPEQSDHTEHSDQLEQPQEKIQSVEIPAVKQIEIDISSSQKDENAGERNKEQNHNKSLTVEQDQGAHQNTNDEKMKQMSDKIKSFLQEQWGIQRNVISVVVDEANFKE
ncbi:stage III sporulation protein AF [Paenibacillus turicensis]|uniref:Stage III sporulation protein AF n=1 Tax=Paenibacillus turicensis TaxID=160487 RepID=A0ABS4FVL6_9BACL|nr:stage III sporulation protein AF [Paenibacillus turicensis]MBP1906621.1 stage III sporulation protein AF [Paenibacillus turicensis]